MANYQATLRGVTMGASTNYPIVGFDMPSPEIIRNDLARILSDGAFQGPHRLSTLVVTLNIECVGTDAATLLTNLQTLATAWLVSNTNLSFTVTLPGLGTRTLSGRPIAFEQPVFEPIHVKWLRIPNIRARFEAGVPVWT